MLSFFGGHDDDTREREQGHPIGQPEFANGHRVVQDREPDNMVRYSGSTADGNFMQNSGVNGHSIPTFQQQPMAPYPRSMYTNAPGEPTPSTKVVSERKITRDELFSQGSLVEGPQQRIEVSPLLMDIPGGSYQPPKMPMQVQMPAPMGGSVRMDAGPMMPMQVQQMPVQVQQMPAPMGGSVQLSAAPFGGAIMAPGSNYYAQPATTAYAAPVPTSYVQPAVGGGFVRQLNPQMGGPPQIGAPMQSMTVAPGGSYTAPPMQPMMAAPGGSYTAAPMQPMMGVPGGSFTAPPMQPMMGAPMMGAPGGFVRAAPMQPMMGAPGGSFTAAPMQPMAMPGNFMQVVPQAGNPPTTADYFGTQPRAGGSWGQLPQVMGGSIKMPVANPSGVSIGSCGNAGCAMAGTLMCSRCATKAYCSAECQQKDWPNHKAACKKIAAGR